MEKLKEVEIQALIGMLELIEPIKTPNNSEYRFYPKTVEEAKKYFGKYQLDWVEAYDGLQSKGYLMQISGELCLTDSGKKEARRLRLDRPPIWYTYRHYYETVKDSEAHAEFCERLYGRNLSQDGFSDMNQINKLIELAQIKSTSVVLDLGCGSGLISEYISDVTGAVVYGIDYIPEAIEHAEERTTGKRERLKFYTGNLDYITFPQKSFHCIISIDSLYMPNNLIQQ